MTWQELKNEGTTYLEKAGIDNAAYDAKELLLAVSGFTMTTYPLHMRESADEDRAKRYMEYIRRRAKHEPLQYITGTAYFYGEPFAVEPGVLIPRYDTETLVEAVLPHLKEDMKVLDLCCGSGCILITLLRNGPKSTTGTGADISETAIRVTKRNRERFHLEDRMSVVQSDLFSGVTQSYDIIVSNPPYISHADIENLQEEVKDFEPRLALEGGKDGLDFYRKIAEQSGEYLKTKGLLAVEIGYDQKTAVQKIFEQNGFSDVFCVQDLSGRDRAVLGVKSW
jgi:release factor glutamine methyltransferase